MKYLFWNTHKNDDINDVLSELIIENNISMVLLAEYAANADELINKLAARDIDMLQYGSCSERIKMFGRIENIQYRMDSDHAVIRIINDKDILCCIHLNSKIYSDHEEIREIHMDQIIKDVQNVERELQSGKEFYMFYNPMWNLLGDAQEPYGTYYYAGNDPINTYWNIYDQVIIRPALRARFVENSLRIIKETKTRFLLDSNGHPDKKISDHLPIVFEIKED